MTNGFALNHDKSLQIYFFCVKRQAKNDFLKDVESTVVPWVFSQLFVTLVQKVINSTKLCKELLTSCG